MERKEKVQKALEWLNENGWSELIDPRWTLEVYHQLQNSRLGLSDAEIRESLEIVIYEEPDYNPANNERLVRVMNDDVPIHEE